MCPKSLAHLLGSLVRVSRRVKQIDNANNSFVFHRIDQWCLPIHAIKQQMNNATYTRVVMGYNVVPSGNTHNQAM